MSPRIARGDAELEVVLLPGLGARSTSIGRSENPELVDLHRTLSRFGTVTTLLHMPDIDQPSEACMDIERVVAGLVERLGGACRSTVVVGYSIGGYLAFDVCRRLAQAGAPVRLLLMLDSSAFFVPPERTSLASELVQSARAGARRVLVAAPFLVALRSGRLELARRWLALLRRVGGASRGGDLRLRLLVAYWFEATARRDLRPYDGPVVLLKARKGRPRIADATLGWSPLAPRLKVCVVEGDHWTVLQSPDLLRQVAAELEAVAEPPSC